MSGEKNDEKLFITKLQRFYKEKSGFVDWRNAGFAIQNLMFMFTLVVDLYKNGERTEVDPSMLDKINKEYVKLFKQLSPQTINRVNGDDDTSSCFRYPANSPFSKQNKSVSKEELKKDTDVFFNFFRNSIYEDLKNHDDEISEEEKNKVDSIFVFEVDVEEKKLVSFSTSNSIGTVSYPVLVSLTKIMKGQRDVEAKFLKTHPSGVPEELEFFDSNESNVFFLFNNFARSLLYFHVFYRNLYTKMFYNSCKKISEAFEPTDKFEQGKVLMQLLLEKSCKSSVNNLQIERFPFAKNTEGHFFLETMAYSILMAFRIIEIGGTILDAPNKMDEAVNFLRVEFFRNQSNPFVKKTRTYFKERYDKDNSLKALPALSDY